MGNIFCSYYMNNSISRLRTSILNSELIEIKQQLRASNSSIYYTLSNNIDIKIDNIGNTPLLFSTEYQKIESFRFLLNEFKPDVNRGNAQTGFKPLHICALTKVLNSKASIRSQYGIHTVFLIILTCLMSNVSYVKVTLHTNF